MCVIRAHQDHDYEPATFPDRGDKEKFLETVNTFKIDNDKELHLLKGTFRSELINTVTDKLKEKKAFEEWKEIVLSAIRS
uniref:Cytochrome n=1 Tax=Steinernema glaseri TaxID=37863 RepID=A0A1I7Y8B0_9BILA